MGYIARRVGQGALVLWAAFTVSFVLLQAIPGDAIQSRFMNPDLGLSPAAIAELQKSYGSNSPLIAQYFHSAISFLTGNLGDSLQTGAPVSRLIFEALPGTILLALFGLIFAVLLAVAVAWLSTLSRFRWLRNIFRSLPSVFVAIPVFWLGILFIELFSFQLKLVPIINPTPVQGLILPVLTVAVPISAPLAQVLVRSIDELELSPFVAVSAAKGASRQWLLWKDIARNAVLPALTIAGILFGELVGSAIVTETIFGRNGIGRLTTAAVSGQDIPVLQAVVVISATIYVIVNLGIDLLYPVLDPRLKRGVGVTA